MYFVLQAACKRPQKPTVHIRALHPGVQHTVSPWSVPEPVVVAFARICLGPFGSSSTSFLSAASVSPLPLLLRRSPFSRPRAFRPPLKPRSRTHHHAALTPRTHVYASHTPPPSPFPTTPPPRPPLAGWPRSLHRVRGLSTQCDADRRLSVTLRYLMPLLGPLLGPL